MTPCANCKRMEAVVGAARKWKKAIEASRIKWNSAETQRAGRVVFATLKTLDDHAVTQETKREEK